MSGFLAARDAMCSAGLRLPVNQAPSHAWSLLANSMHTRPHVRHAPPHAVPSIEECTRERLHMVTAASPAVNAAPAATAAAHANSSSGAAVASILQSRLHIRPIAEQCRELRQKVCLEFLAGGLLYVESGEQVMRNGSDVYFKHRADSNFVYLAGVEQPGFAALIDTETGRFTLLAPRLPPEMAYWVGATPSLDQLAEQYGADSCCYTDELKKLLAAQPSQDVHTLPTLDAKVRAAAPNGVRVTSDLLPATLARCRTIKTDAELACLMRANIVSGAAHMHMWRAAKPGLREYQLEAVFSCAARAGGLSAPGYPPIVGTGANAAIMHYEAGEGLLHHDHLVLVDAGAEFRCYTADITRTFPASGTFQGAQRDLYGAVLAAQHAALDVLAAHPQPQPRASATSPPARASLQDADRAARLMLLSALHDMGVVRLPGGGVGTASLEAALDAKLDRTFMPHGIGHFLGLDVHDVGEAGPVPKGPLQAGHVVTVEPGAYFIPALLAKAKGDAALAQMVDFDLVERLMRGGLGGVRIEDNVALMAEGEGGSGSGRQAKQQQQQPAVLFNLTEAAGVVKGMAEVEAVMAQRWSPEELMAAAL